MTRKLAILAAAVALTMGAGAASAGGGLKGFGEPERRCGGGPFAGMYVGAHIGYMEHDADFAHLSDDDGSFTGGVVSGYNIQCGRFLIGYEGDISALDTSPSASVFQNPPGRTTLESSVDWYGSSRLRLGLVHNDNLLFFVSGGLAYGEVDHKLSVEDFTRSDGDTQYGWILGGGVEFLRAGNWTLRAEGYYVDLGSETETYSVTAADSRYCTTTCTARVKWEDDFWTARVGIAYKFGRREEAIPLK